MRANLPPPLIPPRKGEGVDWNFCEEENGSLGATTSWFDRLTMRSTER
jgi:hypothetical protein